MTGLGWAGRPWRSSGALAALLVLAACGGGGGSQTPNVSDNTAARFSADYAPLATGDRRLWRVTLPGSPDSLHSEVVGPAPELAGQSALALRDETGLQEYAVRTANGVQSVPGPGSDALTVAAGPVDVLRFGLVAGESALLIDRTLSADVDGDRQADEVQLRAETVVVEFGALDTRLQRFVDTAHLRTTVRTAVKRAFGVNTTLVMTLDEWYARGIGVVRSVTQRQVDGRSVPTETHDILAYGVGALRSDNTAPALVLASPADGSAIQPTRLITLSFSKTMDATALADAANVRLLDDQGRPVDVQRSVQDSLTDLSLWVAQPLAPGAYTLSLGGALVDWSNNSLAATALRFVVDTTGPKPLASVPANGQDDAAWTGKVSITFDETVLSSAPAALMIEITELSGRYAVQRLPAVLIGNTLTAQIASPLPPNRAFRMRALGPLADRAGNPLDAEAARIEFQSDPGPLARPLALSPGLQVSTLRLGDMDGDGRQDLVFMGRDPADGRAYLAMRPGLAAGGFGPTRRLQEVQTTGGYPCESGAMALGDFDGDGRLDAALSCGAFLRVLMQTAPGSFVNERPGFNGTEGLGVVDLDLDGRADLVLVGTGPGIDVGGQKDWHVIKRQPGGIWVAVTQLPIGANFAFPNGARVTDIDGDGRADAAWLRRYADGRMELAWALARQGGYAPTQAATVADSADFFDDLAVGDLDRDGLTDFVALGWRDGRRQFAVLKGQAGGAAAVVQWQEVAGESGRVAIADVDGDGRADLIIGHGPGTVGISLQGQDGRFEAERLFDLTGSNPADGHALMADVDGDGLPDLVMQGVVLLRRPFAGVWPAAAAGGPAAAQSVNQPLRRRLLPMLSKPGRFR